MYESHAKQLTRNDLGITGGHQGGICVPRKTGNLLDFFPTLDGSKKNPRTTLECIDPEGTSWKMNYIYYNGKLDGSSTRNEYRITFMTRFFRKWKAAENDSVVFQATDAPQTYRIHIEKNPTNQSARKNADAKPTHEEPPVIVLKGWRRIH